MKYLNDFLGLQDKENFLKEILFLYIRFYNNRSNVIYLSSFHTIYIEQINISHERAQERSKCILMTKKLSITILHKEIVLKKDYFN